MRHIIAYAILLTLAAVACTTEDKDTTAPVIATAGFDTNPIDCQTYHAGDTIHFCYLFEDNRELGAYNIEIHNNFDHHTHGTSATDCEDGHHDEENEGHEHHDDEETPAGAWVFVQDYAIPSGTTSYLAKQDIAIPLDITAGDYHFSIRLTDRAGWQEIKAIAIKIKTTQALEE